MGSSDSKPTEQKDYVEHSRRREMKMQEKRAAQKRRLEEQTLFIQEWPQNARMFSGKPLPGMVYVAVIFNNMRETHQPWMAFETRKEACECLQDYGQCTPRLRQPFPFVYALYVYSDEDVFSWISVVPRKQAREASLYCEDPVELNPVAEGSAPEGSTAPAQ